MKHNDILYKKRKPRLLWANVYCLLDSSSGASMSVLPEHWKKRLETTDILEL